jgi:hypothetical protein
MNVKTLNPYNQICYSFSGYKCVFIFIKPWTL